MSGERPGSSADSAAEARTGTRDPDALLARAGVRGDPDHDQHFLVDDRVLDRLPGYAEEDDADLSHVLEVGDGRLTVVEGDALEVELPEFTASVSNLPYGPSSELAFRLLPEGQPLVLMFQREFAERMAAEPDTDDYGRLSVTAGHYADVEVVEPVPKEAFSPPPAVQSAVVRAEPRDPDYGLADEEFFMDFLKAVFTQRRKAMRNAVRNTAHISGLDDPDAVVEAADEDLMSRRAGKVTPEEFADLATLASEVGEPGE